MGDMKISGSGKISGGEYSTVSISGSGKVEGNLVCQELKVAGSGHVLGSIKCNTAGISGSFHCDGGMKAEKVSCSGSVHIEGEITGGEVSIAGSAHIGGANCRLLRMAGAIRSDSDACADEVRIAGAIRVDGLLSGDRIDIELDGASSAEQIGGGEITIRRKNGKKIFVSLFGGKNTSTFSCDTVEGDKIELECVKCERVSGANVHIMAGCNIGTVEYTESIIIDEGANVDSYQKIEH